MKDRVYKSDIDRLNVCVCEYVNMCDRARQKCKKKIQLQLQLQQRQRTLSEESVFGYYILWAEISLHASEQQRENNDLPM